MSHPFRQLVFPLVVATACAAGCNTDPNSPDASARAADPAAAPMSSVAATPVAAAEPAAVKAESVSLPSPSAPISSFHELKSTLLDGKPADLADYKGKVLLVVNTASECGLTPQYAGLEQLHEELAAKGFSVLGFPSNDFGGQEPGTPAQIQEFCSSKYAIKFPLFGKVQTKAGDGQSPVYAWLGARAGQLPRWNFGKYLIGKDGQIVTYFDCKLTPEDPALRKAIDAALAK